MSTTQSHTLSRSPSSDRNSGSSSFKCTENMPPSVDSSCNVSKLRRGQAKNVPPSQSVGSIHKFHLRKRPQSFTIPAKRPFESTGCEKISQSVRDAFIPPRHNFVNGKQTVMFGATEKCTIAPSGIIFELGEHDIVCGRGAPSNLQEGNKMFREMVEEYQAFYLCSKRADKPKIAIQVMEEVRARGGRFVRRVKTATNGRSFGWEELEEKRSYEKVCQALREGAPEIRRKMLSCNKIREEKQQNDQTSSERPLPVFQDGSYSCHYY